MLRLQLVAFILITSTFVSVADETQRGVPPTEASYQFNFLPAGIIFRPLVASFHEARVGIRHQISTSHLKVDIGSTLDLLEVTSNGSKDEQLRLGIDFFTYALTTSYQNFRLQLATADGFFGGHVTFRSRSDQGDFAARLRILHQSSHLLDGQFENQSLMWRDGKLPIPFARDFGELTFSWDFVSKKLRTRLYSGFSYASLVRPTDIRRISTIHGVEFRSPNVLESLFDKEFNLYFAYNLSFLGVPTYIGSNNWEIGAKFGEWSSTGIKVYFGYYNGLDPFTQYFDQRREQWNVGFSFDFWQ